MLPPDYLINRIDEITAMYSDLETAILADIARRLRDTLAVDGTAELIPSSAYQAEQLNQAGMLRGEIIRRIAEINDMSREEVRKLFNDAAITTRRYDDRVYRAAGLDPVPVMQSPSMLRILEAGISREIGSLQRLTGTFALNAEDRFGELLNLGYNMTVSGAQSPQQAIAAAVDDLAREGVKVFSYASGRAISLEAAVRMNVLTAANQTAAKITEETMREMGVSLVRTTAHVGARTHKDGGFKDHSLWQGRVFRWAEMAQNTLQSTVDGDIINKQGNAQGDIRDKIRIDSKQFGKKIGKHSRDYGLDPTKHEDREKMREIINDIVDNSTEIRRGVWPGQGEVDFHIKDADVVIVRDGVFVSILKSGITNPKVVNAKKVS